MEFTGISTGSRQNVSSVPERDKQKLTADDIFFRVTNPDLLVLVPEYPYLEKFVTKTHKGNNNYKYSIDYSNVDASYAISLAVAKEYLDLDLYLDKSHLCPRIPNRLDYVLWIDRLLESYESDRDMVTGLDIGVGASCIYPLLGCTLFPAWKMYGTDISDESLRMARLNLERNKNLLNRIVIVPTKNNDPIFNLDSILAWTSHETVGPIFRNHQKSPDIIFTMCNPPFYENAQEMKILRELKSDDPQNLELWATDNELFIEGGESKFTMRMIEESLLLRERVIWYTTLVGKKETLIQLVNRLHEVGVNNYALHEICPGKTTRRWTIGWSFTDYHPRKKDSRVKVLKPELNPVPTELIIYDFGADVQNTNSVRLMDDLENILMSLTGRYFSWKREKSHQDKDSIIIVEFVIDVWSRSYRRASSRKNDQNERFIPLPRPSTIVQIESRSNIINAWWKYGRDYKQFESFIGMLKKKLASLATAE